jgi:phage tail sheath protein FI
VANYKSPGVYVQEVSSGSQPIEGVGTAVAAFVGIATDGPLNRPTLVSNWSQFTSTFGEFLEDSYLAHSVYGFFQNGGGNCYVVRVGSTNGNGAKPQMAQLLAKGDDNQEIPRYEVKALPSAPLGERLEVEISEPSAAPSGDGEQKDPPATFSMTVLRGGQPVEQFDDLQVGRGKQSAVAVVNAASQLISLTEVSGAPATLPSPTKVELTSPPSLPERLETSDYVGDPADRTGFGGLEAVEEITMVCAPDLMSAFEKGWIDLTGVTAVQNAMIAHCEQMGNRVAILDPPPDLNPQQVSDWRTNVVRHDSAQAVLYWPWLKVADPASGNTISVPPSGHLAGLWGRNDEERGVHKAPANEVVRGVIDLTCNLTTKEQELLNPKGINCIRAFPGRGIRVWGARTLSSEPAWRYLNVRRLFNYLSASIMNGTQWVVFEPNDEALWAKIRRTIASFLVNEWRSGALFGSTPDEAFYVKCDDETNPAEGIDAGEVVCEIGVAPVKPAEFVIFRLSQFSGGTSLVE